LCPRCPKLDWCSPFEVCVEVKTVEKTLPNAPPMSPISHPSSPEGPETNVGLPEILSSDPKNLTGRAVLLATGDLT